MPKKQNTPPDVISLKLLSTAEGYDGVKRTEIFRVDPDLVTFEKGFNVRTDDDSLKEHQEKLFVAMKNGASIPPIDVRVENGVIIVVEGHSRTLAARRLKKEVPEFTLEARQFRGNEQDRVLHMLGTGNGQKPLTPLESGIGYLRLMKWGMTPQQIAEKQGVSRVTIDNCLALAEAPVEVQELVRSGAVSSTTARDALKGGAEGIEALKAAAVAVDPAPSKNGKKSKKKKVTAKKLKGTAAEKKPKKKKKAKKAAESAGDETVTIGKDEICVIVKKAGAQKAVDFMKQNAPDTDADLNELIATIELALM